ncbi:MAG: glycosyltransferase family 4 protein [Planctomycetota bacterium]|jgi:glycosyltransferase involved in cell wall biosynthesis|nr:glycosyltransferase family 4 protein [Planctomycetota bacterium]
MHILLLRQHFALPDQAGSGRPYEMASRWIKAGHQVTIVTSSAKLSPQHKSEGGVIRTTVDGIRIIAVDVPYENHFGYIRRIFAFLSFARKCVKACRDLDDVDVVLGSSTPLTVAVPAVRLSRKLRVPMVFEVRDLWPEMPIAIGAIRNPILKGAARALERYAYRHSKRIIALSPGMASGIAAAGYPEQKIAMIPNASDVARFRSPNVSAEEFLEDYPMLKGRKIVLYAGTLGRLNGVSYLVDVAQEMQKLDPKVAFVVFGNGACREELIRSAENRGVLDKNFFFLGSIPKNKIPNAHAAASICTSLFVNIPEMWKNSANKFFDTLAAARPILINYEGWQQNLINECGIGISVPAKDPIEGAKRINRSMSDPEELRRIGKRAGELGEERFSLDDLAQRALNVLCAATSSGDERHP